MCYFEEIVINLLLWSFVAMAYFLVRIRLIAAKEKQKRMVLIAPKHATPKYFYAEVGELLEIIRNEDDAIKKKRYLRIYNGLRYTRLLMYGLFFFAFLLLFLKNFNNC